MVSLKAKKRQAASDPVLPTTTEKERFDVYQGEIANGVLLEDDLNEPTMGEKLASVSLLGQNKSKSDKEQESYIRSGPPSADSINVLLKQALRADDCALLLECMYTQDEKVITRSISQLDPFNVLKLLHSLIYIVESRGAILACLLPWLKCLLLQHASGIMSQESSLPALNSLYQLSEEEVDSGQTVPVIYEDKDESEESEDAVETEQDREDELSDEAFDCANGDLMSE